MSFYKFSSKSKKDLKNTKNALSKKKRAKRRENIYTDFQAVTKKYKKNFKKNDKKRYNVLKNSVPLHRFNKQLIVLQV